MGFELLRDAEGGRAVEEVCDRSGGADAAAELQAVLAPLPRVRTLVRVRARLRGPGQA